MPGIYKTSSPKIPLFTNSVSHCRSMSEVESNYPASLIFYVRHFLLLPDLKDHETGIFIIFPHSSCSPHALAFLPQPPCYAYVLAFAPNDSYSYRLALPIVTFPLFLTPIGAVRANQTAPIGVKRNEKSK